MKKTISIIVIGIMILLTFSGCSSKEFNPNNDITVISREEGSGTRGAFIELFGIEQKDENGNKVDHTIETADINDSTGITLTNVALNQNAIGYISLGALNDTVKALRIEGVKPTFENVKNGSYKIARPFNIATKEKLSAVAKDFVSFILSEQGQKVVEEKGYIAISDSSQYSGTKPAGKIVIAGSSSVTPLMEKLKEAYLEINTNASIEIQQSDSTTGINSTSEGICDIGMASRELKKSELEKGLYATTIAIDGIAVIVNTKNTAETLSIAQVRSIYTGSSTTWSDVLE